jgi:predicted aspartyl protease
MVRYRFNQQRNPRPPYIHVAVRRADGLRSLNEVVAQLDTGADMTVLPASFLHEMNLVRFREIRASDS